MPSQATAALLAKLETLAATDQEDLVEVGSQFGTEDVLLQIARFGDAEAEVGAIPSRYGFTEGDAAELGPLGEAILDISGVRVTKGVARNTSTAEFRDVVTRGKRAVSNARTVLANADRALRRASGGEGREVRSLINATLQKLGSVERSKLRLTGQLTALRAIFQDEAVAAALKGRGGPETMAVIDAALVELGARVAPGEKVRGSPNETRQLNLLEGHAVTILRQARAAAREWSLDSRDPTRAKAYELEFLYSGQASSPAPTSGAPATPTVGPATP